MEGPVTSKGKVDSSRLDLIAAVLAIFSVLVQGHRLGEGGQEALLLGVARVLDLTWLVNDWFLSVPQMRSDMIGLLALGSRVMGDAAFFLLLHLVTRFVLLAGTWRLVEALLPGQYRVAMMALPGVLLLPHLIPGTLDLMAPQWEPENLGAALVVWFLAEGIRCVQMRGNPVGMTLLGGLALFFAPGIALPAILGTALFHWFRGLAPKEITLVFIGAMFLGSTAWVPLVIEAFTGAEFLADRSFIQAMQFHDPALYQPWTWSAFAILQVLLLTGGAVIGWWTFLPTRRRSDLLILLPVLLWMILGGAAWMLAGALEVSPELVMSAPLRLLFLPMILAFALAVALLFELLRDRPWYLPVLGALLLLLPWHDSSMGGPLIVALTIIWFPVLGIRLETWRPTPLPRWCRPAGWAAVVVGVVLVWGIQTRGEWRERLAGERWLVEPIATDDGRRELVAWIRMNTPREAVFAIPPSMERFRILEQRSIVVDLGLVPRRREQLAQWVERVSLGTNAMVLTSRPENTFEDVSVQQLVLLAQTHGARFVVVRESLFHPVVVHRVGGYSILDLERDGILLNNW